ncbi:hypothetical protein FGO68_gene945 [Halteria grandinella]|uniref:Uncharacterized protein n=1 Tax=Halteria grandinella TaxID=5974 RepID=A0A8J8NNL8_HALGN|nr:hypothetical protein FGO68_gene945 [Halteria grandinella]
MRAGGAASFQDDGKSKYDTFTKSPDNSEEDDSENPTSQMPAQTSSTQTQPLHGNVAVHIALPALQSGHHRSNAMHIRIDSSGTKPQENVLATTFEQPGEEDAVQDGADKVDEEEHTKLTLNLTKKRVSSLATSMIAMLRIQSFPLINSTIAISSIKQSSR